jgi:hypothetical protein
MVQYRPWYCCSNLKLRYGTLRQFSRKQHFIVRTQTQQSCLQRLSPENKEVLPYIPLQAGYRSKQQSSTHIWLHVTSLVILFPQCYVTFFMFQFFKFYLPALPSLPSASLSEHSLSVSPLSLLPATVLGQHHDPLTIQTPFTIGTLANRALFSLYHCVTKSMCPLFLQDLTF